MKNFNKAWIYENDNDNIKFLCEQCNDLKEDVKLYEYKQKIRIWLCDECRKKNEKKLKIKYKYITS